MANTTGQRVAAFLLALLFLLSSVGAAAFVVWEVNQEDAGLVADANPANSTLPDETPPPSCGADELADVGTRSVPNVTKVAVPVTDLQKVDVKVGDGEEVKAGDCVTAKYYGTLAKDGTKFDGNYDVEQPSQFSLSGVIDGWAEGIPGMKVGGVRRLVIPAEKAYGEQESGAIPANSDLVFEVEIVGTKRGQ